MSARTARRHAPAMPQAPATKKAGTIAIPCVDWLWTEAAISWITLDKPRDTQLRFSLGGANLAEKRNKMIREALDDGGDWLFFADSDMKFPPHTLQRLLTLDAPIASGFYIMRKPPHQPCAGYKQEDGSFRFMSEDEYKAGNGGPVAVDFIGMGACLIRREALIQIGDPWFGWAPEYETEDLVFCDNAKRAGVPIVVDTGLVVPHLAVYGFGSAQGG